MAANKGVVYLEIRIKPTKLLYFDEDKFYGIYGVEVHKEDVHKVRLNRWKNISIKGNMPKLNIGEEYTVDVKYDKEAKYPATYILEAIKPKEITKIENQKEFLSTLLTETQVENIYSFYKEDEDIIKLIQNDEFNYRAIKGIGEKSYTKMKDKILKNLGMSEILTFCGKYGIKFSVVGKLLELYKNASIVIQRIEKNPYEITSVNGVGFKKADEIARAIGYDLLSPHRIDAALVYIVEEENANGHSWIDYKKLLNKAIELLDIPKENIEARLRAEPEGLENIDGRITKRVIYKTESLIAKRMINIKKQSRKLFDDDELEKLLNEYCERNNIQLEEEQRQFFFNWNENNISFLIGYGGSGKTYLQKILLHLIDKKKLSVALLSPTGKASKVQSAYTGREASTIHRRVSYIQKEDDDDEKGFGGIKEDVIIVDEASMCDIFILARFFKSIEKENAKILFVGDDFQLPSVGVGNFLYDSIHSGCVQISKLKKVFRQSEGGILDIATKVRNGQSFLGENYEGRFQFGKDCVFWLVDQDYIKDGVISNYKNVIKKFDKDDVIVLSPTNKGALGTVVLNKEIQAIVNPPSPDKKEKSFGKNDNKVTFRVGDSVMNTVNTYNTYTVNGSMANIFNGDSGKIIDIDEEKKLFVIDFDGIIVKLTFDNVRDKLVHSWCLSIHKSQGGSFKVVIVIIDKSMKFQLNANLIYTGFSRAQQYMLVLGQANAINYGIRKFANIERRSFLKELLIEFDEKIEDGENVG